MNAVSRPGGRAAAGNGVWPVPMIAPPRSNTVAEMLTLDRSLPPGGLRRAPLTAR